MEATDQPVRIAVVDRPLDPAAAVGEVERSSAGAVVMFMGTVRDHSELHRDVIRLEYEAYEERVEAVIEGIVAEACRMWQILAGVVEHRVGTVDLGDPAVVVAVSAAHRSDAFEAARYLIDELKRRAPLWKKEHWPGGGEWVEGA